MAPLPLLTFTQFEARNLVGHRRGREEEAGLARLLGEQPRERLQRQCLDVQRHHLRVDPAVRVTGLTTLKHVPSQR
jgi:hypothetical protein